MRLAWATVTQSFCWPKVCTFLYCIKQISEIAFVELNIQSNSYVCPGQLFVFESCKKSMFKMTNTILHQIKLQLTFARMVFKKCHFFYSLQRGFYEFSPTWIQKMEFLGLGRAQVKRSQLGLESSKFNVQHKYYMFIVFPLSPKFRLVILTRL